VLHHGRLLYILWLAWLLYWVISAFGAKTTRRRESSASRLSHVLPLLVGVTLIAWPHPHLGHWMSWQFLPPGPARFASALVLVAAGLAFTVWARVQLGTNWSGSVTLKEGHELVRSGPYAIVRHPIYTGLLVALLGTAVACGELRALIGLAVVAAAFVRKLRIEERFMRESFPEQYARYSAEVPALIPFARPRRSAPH
jgi:protein-S-isoprenylcysteine O-methyltransferase Ste14